MKIKGVIEDLNLKKIKIYIYSSKNISRTFSHVIVVDSVGSVHFQIVP